LHAHPPFATAYGLADLELQPLSIPEIVVSLGDRIPTIPRFMPKDPEGAKRVSTEAAKYDAMLLSGNGALTLGSDLGQALLRMELVEHYAKILQIACTIGAVRPLAQPEVEALLQARKKAGLGPRQ
jgi:L-fuculose-phosphate aldolase